MGYGLAYREDEVRKGIGKELRLGGKSRRRRTLLRGRWKSREGQCRENKQAHSEPRARRPAKPFRTCRRRLAQILLRKITVHPDGSCKGSAAWLSFFVLMRHSAATKARCPRFGTSLERNADRDRDDPATRLHATP